MMWRVVRALFNFEGLREGKPLGGLFREAETRRNGGVAQLGEHLPCKQGVDSSILFVSTSGEPPLPNRVSDTSQDEPDIRGARTEQATDTSR